MKVLFLVAFATLLASTTPAVLSLDNNPPIPNDPTRTHPYFYQKTSVKSVTDHQGSGQNSKGLEGSIGGLLNQYSNLHDKYQETFACGKEKNHLSGNANKVMG